MLPSPTHVLGLHDVAALAYRSDDLVRVIHEGLPRRRHRPRLAVTSTRVGRDVEFHTLRDADAARVT